MKKILFKTALKLKLEKLAEMISPSLYINEKGKKCLEWFLEGINSVTDEEVVEFQEKIKIYCEQDATGGE